MNVIIYVGANTLQMTPLLPKEQLRILQRKFTFEVDGCQFSPKFQMGQWDGNIRLLKKNQIAPTGCIYRLKRLVQEFGHTVDIQFELDYPPLGEPSINGLTLEDFQLQSVERAVKYRYCVIEAPVRAGKTAIMSSLIKKIGHFPVWVITWRKDLVRQTQIEISKHLGRPIGCFTESKFFPEEIIVSSYQALHSAFGEATRSNVKNAWVKERNVQIEANVRRAKVLLMDECHHALSRKFKNVLDRFESTGYRIGLSATPRPDSKDSLEVESVLGGIAARVPFSKLIEKKRIAQPIICVYDLPYSWFSNVLAEFSDVYEVNIVRNECRNKFIADVVKHLNDRNKSVFINVSRVDHGAILQGLIPNSVYLHGGVSADARAQVFNALQEKSVKCVIATIGKEGMNIPRLDAVINAEGGKSKVTTKQKMRSLTASIGKKYGLVIDFYDKGKFLRKQSKSRINVYSNLTGFVVKHKKVNSDYFAEGSRWIRTKQK